MGRRLFGETGIKFVAFYPALNIEEQAILSNFEFYQLVKKAAERFVQQYPENIKQVLERLEEIKKILGL